MKVELHGEQGIVITPVDNSDWDKEPGIIRWDSDKEKDEEDWRGLFGVFIDEGGKELSQEYKFKFITDEGLLKVKNENN